MLIGFVFSLLTATYTITSRNAVTPSGDLPSGSVCHYVTSATSGSSGQLTAGNAATLTLTGWHDIYLRSISLTMHSNTAAGAGSLTMWVGEHHLWAIPDLDFASVRWNGAYSKDWVTITHSLNCRLSASDTLYIRIKASVNSLYIQSYTFTYEQADPRAYTVSWRTGMSSAPDPVTELNPGEGIVLPSWHDTLDWTFCGWVDHAIKHMTDRTDGLFKPGDRFHPMANTTLWAAYRQGEGSHVTAYPASGRYALLRERLGLTYLLRSVPDDGVMPVYPVTTDTMPDGLVLIDDLPDDALYDVVWLSDTTLTLQHVTGGEFITANASRILLGETPWRCRIFDNGAFTLFVPSKSSDSHLWVGYGVSAESDSLIAYMAPTRDVTAAYAWRLVEPGALVYTSTPCLTQSVDGISAQAGETLTIPFGIYELQIIEGKKRIRLHH